MQVPAAGERRKHAPPATASTIHITCAACSHLHTHTHTPAHSHTGPRSVDCEDCNRITTRQPTGTTAVHAHQRHSTAQRLTALRPLQQHNRKLHATEFDSTSTPSEEATPVRTVSQPTSTRSTHRAPRHGTAPHSPQPPLIAHIDTVAHPPAYQTAKPHSLQGAAVLVTHSGCSLGAPRTCHSRHPPTYPPTHPHSERTRRQARRKQRPPHKTALQLNRTLVENARSTANPRYSHRALLYAPHANTTTTEAAVDTMPTLLHAPVTSAKESTTTAAA
uniref:Uncharacterized protein n=1 Tax=Echinococcus granulosus TaxID=6210 RepID=A0A068WWS4_ECHGR|nr:hypothetical protein EgrG_002026300 [Echinococcus granulosus]